MAATGTRLGIERQKLCIWLESEKRKLQSLPHDVKQAREVELERDFRTRLDRLYGDMPHRQDAKAPAAKLN